MLHEQLVSDRDSVADKEKNALFKNMLKNLDILIEKYDVTLS